MPEPNETEFNKQKETNLENPDETASCPSEYAEMEGRADCVVPSNSSAIELNAPDALKESQDSNTLEEALEKHGIKLPPKTVRLLNEYCELLWTWNERLNLTRHTTFDKFVSRDLIDSIRLASHLQTGEHVLDVGSGGGVPGLVIAILRPDVVIDLCEATGKKAKALGDMAEKLGININIWYSKAQDLLCEHHFHTLTIRAVDRLYKLLVMFRTSWHCFDRLLLIKGPKWVDERGEARHYNLFNTLALRKIDEYMAPSSQESFTSVILQVCPKKKLNELKRRAEELAEGKPYSGAIEELVVDNRQNEGGFRRRNRSHGSQYNGERTVSNHGSRAYVSVHDNRNATVGAANSDRFGNDSRVYARRGGKPPKGWAGKKSEFHAQTQEGQLKKQATSGKKEWRSNNKRSGSPKYNAQQGNLQD